MYPEIYNTVIETGVEEDTFVLDVLIRRFMGSASTWSDAVKILSSCREDETGAFTIALAEFVQHFSNYAE